MLSQLGLCSCFQPYCNVSVTLLYLPKFHYGSEQLQKETHKDTGKWRCQSYEQTRDFDKFLKTDTEPYRGDEPEQQEPWLKASIFT